MHSIDTFVPQFTTVLNEILTFCQLQNVKISLTHHGEPFQKTYFFVGS